MFNELIPYQACPICDSRRFEVKVRADCSNYLLYKKPLSPTMQWQQCMDCGHVFRDGFFTEAAFDVLFQDSHPGQRAGEDYERQRIVSARMVDRVVPHMQDGIWLDVGFGNGSLLLTAAEFGFIPLGLDLRQQNVDALNALGINALNKDFTAVNLDPRASVISMCDVLEHMQYPLLALRSAHRNLCDGGVLLLSMPNLDSPLWKMLDRAGKNPYWGEMEHFHNFGRGLLYKALGQCGFTPVQYGISERYRACMEVVALKAAV